MDSLDMRNMTDRELLEQAVLDTSETRAMLGALSALVQNNIRMQERTNRDLERRMERVEAWKRRMEIKFPECTDADIPRAAEG